MCALIGVGFAQSSQPPVEVYFNYAVAGNVPAETSFTGSAFSDRMVALVDGATATVDLAAYNFDHAPLADALRRASNRGVRVRVVTDIDTRHPSLLSPAPNYFWLAVNDEGLMHHKFMVVDGALPEDALVVTGSMNFTDANIYRFYNDALLLRSPALAEAFTDEFELLWGGTGEVPNAQASRSGGDKPVRVRPRVQLDDLDIEVYFSPNQEVSERIVDELDSATESVLFQLLILTYDDIGSAMVRAHERGIDLAGVVENFDDSSSEYFFLRGRGVRIEAHTPDEVVHHKYGIFDAHLGADATLITGSHNWTYSAETFHDENTLVISGSAALADLYYRAARDRHCELAPASECSDIISQLSPKLVELDLTISPNPTPGVVRVESGRTLNQLKGYRLTDASGRTLQGGLLTDSSASHRLDFSHLPAGNYFLSFQTEAGWSGAHTLSLLR